VPIVPTYDIPQVTPGALPAARQTTPDRLMAANSIGAEQLVKMGAAGQQLGNTFNDIDVAHQIQVNENKAKDADTAYMTGANAILHGTPDSKGNPSPGAYLTKMGGDAVDSFDATTKALSDFKQQLLDGLDNDAQRQAAKHVLETRYEAFATKAAEHKDQQLKVYGIASATSRADAASDLAKTLYNPITDRPVLAYDPTNPEANTPYQQNLQTAKVEANHIVDLRYGVNAAPDVRAQMVKAQMEKVYVGIIGHLYESGKAGDGSTQIAKGYFDQVKSELSPAVRDDIQGKLHAAATQDRVLTYSDQIFDTVRGEKAQMSQVRKDFEAGKLDGKERELIEARIEHRAAKQRMDDNENTASVIGQAQDFLINHPGKSVTDMPKNLYAGAMRTGSLASLDSFAKRGMGNQDDPVLFMDLHDKAAKGGLTQLDIMNSRGKVSDSHFDDLMKTYNGISKQDGARLRADSMINKALQTQDVLSLVKAAKIDTTPKEGSPAAQDYALFTSNVRDALLEAQKNNPKFQQEDLNKIVRGMVKDQVLSGTGLGGFFMTKKKLYQMTPEERAKGFEIPKTDREEMTTEFRKRGIKETEQNYQYWYMKANGGVK